MGNCKSREETTLINAVRTNKKDLFENTIDVQGLNIDEVDQDGMTALMWSARKGRLKMCQKLLEKGADVNKVDNGGASALVWTVRKKGFEFASTTQRKFEIVKRLLEKDSSIKKNHALFVACGQRELDVVEYLLEKGADVNTYAIDSGLTVLMQAGQRRHMSIVQCLVRNGAHVNTQDKLGRTAAMYTVLKGRIPFDILWFLIDNGSLLFIQDKYYNDIFDIRGNDMMLCRQHQYNSLIKTRNNQVRRHNNGTLERKP